MMDEEQRLKRSVQLLRKVVAKRARAKRTMDPVQRAKLLAEAAELEARAAKMRAGK